MFKINSEFLVSQYSHSKFIVYFPDRELIFLVNEDAKNLFLKAKNHFITPKNENEKEFIANLEKVITFENEQNKHVIIPNFQLERVKNTFSPTSVILGITKLCNLKCKYCYANGGEYSDTLLKSIGFSAIDFITKNAIENGQKEISVHFHGGGEPTLKLPLLRTFVSKTILNAQKNKLNYSFSIGTNGVMNDDARSFIKDYINSITISLDGNEHIQNLQRPSIDPKINSYKEVFKTLKYLSNNNIKFGIRSTITKYNCKEIPSFVEFVFKEFKPVSIQLEPVTIVGRAKEDLNIKVDPRCFVEYFSKALNLSREKGYKISYSGVSANKRNNFCSVTKPNFIVTEQGYVSSCLEVLDLKDPRANLFIYGYFDSTKKQFHFDYSKIKKLQEMYVKNFNECKNCIAKYHCAGDCAAKRAIYGNPFKNNAKRCFINKELLKNQLLLKLKTGVEITQWLVDSEEI